MSITNLRDRRRQTGEPVESYSVEFTRWHRDEKPEVVLRGLGDDIAAVDMRRLNSDLAFAALSLGNAARAADNRPESAAGIVTVAMNGRAQVSVELTLFESLETVKWFEDVLDLAKLMVRDMASSRVEASIKALTQSNDP
jgi:hypothetical protein